MEEFLGDIIGLCLKFLMERGELNEDNYCGLLLNIPFLLSLSCSSKLNFMLLFLSANSGALLS